MKLNMIGLCLKKMGEISLDVDTPYLYGVEGSHAVFLQLIGDLNIEVLAAVFLDNTNKIMNYSVLSIGSVNSVNIHLNQLVKLALITNSSKVIIAHNHPSGVLDITDADINTTRYIAKLLKVFDIELVDSLVVTIEDVISILGSIKNG